MRSRWPSLPRRTATRCARRRSASACGPSRCPPSSIRSSRSRSSPISRSTRATSRARFDEADMVIEGEYRVGHQEQLYIENQAMIAVPRPDGGISVHGSMQCPYYVHKAHEAGAAPERQQAVVIQAETGGGFGGKEEYPSMHRHPRGAPGPAHRQARAHDLRPPRGHRGDDQAPPGDRAPPHRRDRGDGRLRGPGHRGGLRRRRLLHADAGRAVARHASRRRPLQLPQRADPRPRGGHEHAAEWRFPRLRRAADGVRGGDAGQSHRARRSTFRRSSCAGAGSTGSATRRRRARS